MAIFGMKGFIRKQEVAFARKLLVWKYEKSGTVLPGPKVISDHAEKVVEEAHLIAKKSGKNLFDIMKDAVREIKK